MKDEEKGSKRLTISVNDYPELVEWVRLWYLRPFMWIALAVAGVLILIPKYRDVMYISGVLDAAAALYAFQILMQIAPKAFNRLYNRNIIALKPDVRGAPPDADPVNDDSLVDAWGAFMEDFKKDMNHPVHQYVFGALFASISLLILLYQLGGGDLVVSFQTFIDLYTASDMTWRLRSLIEPLIGFVIGLMAWRMMNVGLHVWRLGRQFEFNIQSGHPDKCCGLEPLGDLCLWNALIVTIPATFLGFWIIIGPRFPDYVYLKPLLLTLLPVPMLFALVSFIAPLFSLHQVMMGKRSEVVAQLDRLGQDIDLLERELMETPDKLTLKEREDKVKLLKIKREFYDEKKDIPVWPMNSSLLKKFITSQAIPALGLTGLGEPIINMIESLVEFLSSLG